MYAAQGVGLAAPQVGISLRIIVVNLSGEDEPRRSMAFINPEIVETAGKIVAEEGCLSIPEVTAQVKRAQEIRVKYVDEQGQPAEFQAQDLLARILQHEIDHLDGILFIDRLSRIKRDLIKNRLKKKAWATKTAAR